MRAPRPPCSNLNVAGGGHPTGSASGPRGAGEAGGCMGIFLRRLRDIVRRSGVAQFMIGLAILMAGSGPANAQTGPDGRPLPHVVTVDKQGIDLLNGRRTGAESEVSIGPPDAPLFSLSHGAAEGLTGVAWRGWVYITCIPLK